MRVLHTLGQAGCKTGTIAAWWMVWHVDSIYVQYSNFLPCFFADFHYLSGPGKIRCYSSVGIGYIPCTGHHWLLHCGGEGDAKAELQAIQMILGSP